MNRLFTTILKIKKKMKRTFSNTYFLNLCSLNQPISKIYGLDRGTAIDRYYIGSFLEKNSHLIYGTCLELLNNEYTIKYGGSKVLKSDILDINEENNQANIYADLKNMGLIQNDSYDCIILTQIFQFIDKIDDAIAECYRILKPGGSLLITLPSASRIDCVAGVEGDYWRFTKASARFLFSKKFNSLEINSFGNAVVTAKFILGFSKEETSKKQLDFNDKDFPCIITVVATK